MKFRFLENTASFLTGLNVGLMFSLLTACRTLSETPLTYGIEAYPPVSLDDLLVN